MAVRNFIKAVQIKVKSGSTDPTPDATFSNGLEVTQDTVVNLEPEENSVDDVVNSSMSLRSGVTGRLMGNATIGANLCSTDKSNAPSVDPLLRISGLSAKPVIRVATTGTAPAEGVTVTGATSEATGVLRVVDGSSAYIQVLTGTFVAESLGGGYSITSISADLCYGYAPDTEADVVGSVFYYDGLNRKSIKDAACSLSLSSDAGQLVKASIEVMGKEDTANTEEASVPNVTYSPARPIVFMSSQTNMKIGSEDFIPVVLSQEFNLGSTPVMRSNAVDATGLQAGFISSRSDAGGSMTIEMVSIGDLDTNLLQKQKTPIMLAYRYGDGTSGRTIYIRERVVIVGVTPSEQDGIKTWELSFRRIGQDDDELFMIFA